MKKGYSKKSNKALNNLLSMENIVGLVLAILIVFDLKVERNIANLINSPVGIVLSLVTLVVLFVFLNPIVGLLFLIYVYETVKYSSSFLTQYTQPVENVRKNIMNRLNLANEASKDNVEIKVIQKMAPIVKKSEKYGVNFVPNTDEKLKYESL